MASTLAHQVARNERDGTDVVLAGDLTPRRDFTDVRDVVRAYRLLVTEGQPGEAYNVCSGVDVPVSEVADALIAQARRPMRVELDPSRLRPVELPGAPGRPEQAAGRHRVGARDPPRADAVGPARLVAPAGGRGGPDP